MYKNAKNKAEAAYFATSAGSSLKMIPRDGVCGS
jgi:hypothetical protein